MAKRYHQKYNSGYYEGYDDKKRREMTDGSMIYEDRSAIANLPQDVKYHAYPKTGFYLGEYLNDTISGIDHQENKDGMYARKNKQPEKY